MLESLNFYYDGIYSVDMGVVNVRVSGGLFEETFIPNREIKETKISKRDKPYFNGLSLSSYSFGLTLFFEDGFDEDKKRKVARWLNQDYYKEFIFESNPTQIFYCMPEGEMKIYHNGNGEGYIDLTMKCDSPYSYSHEFIQENLEFTYDQNPYLFNHNFSTYVGGTYENTVIKDGALELDKLDCKWSEIFTSTDKWGDILL